MQRNRQQLLDEIFSAFSHRPRIERGFNDHDEGRDFERELGPLMPCEVSFEAIDRAGWGATSGFISMDLPTQLHYMPGLMALCIADFDRANGLPSHLLGLFREDLACHDLYHDLPSLGPDRFVDALVRNRVPFGGFDRDFYIRILAPWFYDAFNPEGNVYMALTTQREKQAFCRFFAFLERKYEIYYRAERTVYAARAMLTGDALTKRLGIQTDAERLTLIELLARLEQRLPDDFPSYRVAPIREALAAGPAP